MKVSLPDIIKDPPTMIKILNTQAINSNYDTKVNKKFKLIATAEYGARRDSIPDAAQESLGIIAMGDNKRNDSRYMKTKHTW